jgi:hypothetical protein
MELRQIALVSETARVSLAELSAVAAALHQQAVGDFGPAWQVQASVSPFPSLADMPAHFWPIIVRENVPQSVHGVHHDQEDQPLAVVEWGSAWPLWASHECLEMLADPWGRRLIAAPSLKSDQGMVQYLVEVCDPCQNGLFSYPALGFDLSDFYTPNYFDPTINVHSVYSFRGNLTEPRQVLPGGYLTWFDPASSSWWQAQYTDQLRILPADDVSEFLAAGKCSLRGAVDRVTKMVQPARAISEDHEILVRSRRYREVSQRGAARKAMLIHDHLDRLSRASDGDCG